MGEKLKDLEFYSSVFHQTLLRWSNHGVWIGRKIWKD